MICKAEKQCMETTPRIIYQFELDPGETLWVVCEGDFTDELYAALAAFVAQRHPGGGER